MSAFNCKMLSSTQGRVRQEREAFNTLFLLLTNELRPPHVIPDVHPVSIATLLGKEEACRWCRRGACGLTC